MPTAVQPTPVSLLSQSASPAELELPGLVMRRALAVASAGLVLLLILGIARTRTDTLREMEGSLDLARVGQLLALFKERPVEDGVRALRNVGGLRGGFLLGLSCRCVQHEVKVEGSGIVPVL